MKWLIVGIMFVIAFLGGVAWDAREKEYYFSQDKGFSHLFERMEDESRDLKSIIQAQRGEIGNLRYQVKMLTPQRRISQHKRVRKPKKTPTPAIP